MIPLFLGLSALNLLLMLAVFVLGLAAAGSEGASGSAYPLHIALAIIGGLVCTLTHMAVFTYFMATSKWLQAATDKGALDPDHYVKPARARKKRAFAVCMAAITLTFIAMLAGAGADPTVKPLWPGEIHLVLGIAAFAANLLAALVQYRLIGEQGSLIDKALAILNQQPGVQLTGS